MNGYALMVTQITMIFMIIADLCILHSAIIFYLNKS